MSDKDRAAITAKQLSDFLHLYNRETDLYEDTVDRSHTVPNELFQKFLVAARYAHMLFLKHSAIVKLCETITH